MADTLQSDLFIPEVCAEYARQAFVEKVDALRLIGPPGSGAPITLMNDPVFSAEGQYIEMPVYKRIATFGARRDITSVSGVTDLEMTGGSEKAVKVHKRLGPLSISRDVGRVTRANQDQAMAEIGRQAGEATLTLMRDTIFNAVRGAIAAMSGTPHTLTLWSATARTNLTRNVINELLYKLGDSRKDMKAILCRSESKRDLVDEYLGAGVTGIADRSEERRVGKEC